MGRGTPIMYVDFVDYDELAHHAGPERLESLRSLTGVDQVLASLERAAAGAPREYDIVVLSDHGQSQGATFRQRYGSTLDEVIRALMGGDVTAVTATSQGEGWGPVNALLTEIRQRPGIAGRVAASALGRPHRRRRGRARRTAEPRHGRRAGPPTSSSAPAATWRTSTSRRMTGRATLEEIDERYPGLVPGLAAHPGVGFVLVKHRGARLGRDRARWCPPPCRRPRRRRRPAGAVRPADGRPPAADRRLHPRRRPARSTAATTPSSTRSRPSRSSSAATAASAARRRVRSSWHPRRCRSTTSRWSARLPSTASWSAGPTRSASVPESGATVSRRGRGRRGAAAARDRGRRPPDRARAGSPWLILGTAALALDLAVGGGPAPLVLGLVLGGLGVAALAIALGLWRRRRWAWMAALVIEGISVVQILLVIAVERRGGRRRARPRLGRGRPARLLLPDAAPRGGGVRPPAAEPAGQARAAGPRSRQSALHQRSADPPSGGQA